MGTSNSRLSPRPPRPPSHHPWSPKRSLSSYFVCGGASSFFICGASSSTSPSEIEDDPAELLVNSTEHGNSKKIRTPRKDSALTNGTGSTSAKLENGHSSERSVAERSVAASDNNHFGNGYGDAEATYRGNLTESKQLVPSHQLVSDQCSGETSNSSFTDERYVESDPVNWRASIDENGANINRILCRGLTNHGSPSSNELGESSSDESLSGNHETAVMAFPNYGSSTTSVGSDSTGDYLLQEAGPTASGLGVSEQGLERRDGNAPQVNVVGVSSSVESSSSSEMNNERRNSGRLFWDSFSRQSRRYAHSRNLFSNDDSDHLGHHDRWNLDFSGDLLGEGVGGDLRSYGSRTQGNHGRRWHSRSEILERIRGGLEGNTPRAAVCPTGIHPSGSCSCESVLRAQESGPQASISRIVMLAEALFEVLDDIHQQPLSDPLSVVSLPAPEAVVNSFAVKNYKKPEGSESSDDVAKCYICLAEYEEGDKIRVLPCHHEYHLACIDKWLKEIHGVCPLCRGDVREGFPEGSASTLETPSRL